MPLRPRPRVKSPFACRWRRTGPLHPNGSFNGRPRADEEAGKAAHPPRLLERVGAQLAKVDAPIVAGIEDDEIDRIEVFAGRHGA